jgi:hypothetical protein
LKNSLDFITSLNDELIRSVHNNEVTRDKLKEKAVKEGYNKTTGKDAHRLIRAHDNIEAFIAFYVDGVAYAKDAYDSPEIDGNVANVTVKYPHGRPVKGIDELLEDHNEDADDWEVQSFTANEWPTTIGTKNDNVIYVNNFQAKARLEKKEREPKYERVKPVKINTPKSPEINPVDKQRPDDWKTALVLMDRQVGHKRDQGSWTYEPIHDREAIDLAVKLSGLVEPEVIVDVGDLLDFAGISPFVETPELNQALQPALCEVAYDNSRLISCADPDEFHILEGNHDKRLKKKLIDDAEEMYQVKDIESQKDNGPPAMSIPKLLSFDDMGITWHDGYPDNEFFLNDGISIQHGDTAKSDSGDTVKYKLKYETTDYSKIFGHIHRFEQAYKTIWKGNERKEVVSASGGCLCSVDGGVPGNKDKQNWQQGVIVVHYDPDGWDHIVEPIKIRKQGDKKVCRYAGKKLISDPPSSEELTEQTGFNFS